MTVRTTSAFDKHRHVMAYRIAGLTAAEVSAEVEKLCADYSPRWALFTPPILWGREYVSHGELQIRQSPPARPLRDR